MKTWRITTISLLFLFVFPVIAYAGQFEAVRVYDGGTVRAVGHDIEIKIRLVGIDAPEVSRKKGQSGQPYSQAAKQYLAELVLDKVVDIKGYGTGPYNRILGIILIDGKNVNLEMIHAGLAEVYRGKPPKGFALEPYRQTERNARADRKGMWALGDEYMSPRDWRKVHRE